MIYGRYLASGMVTSYFYLYRWLSDAPAPPATGQPFKRFRFRFHF